MFRQSSVSVLISTIVFVITLAVAAAVPTGANSKINTVEHQQSAQSCKGYCLVEYYRNTEECRGCPWWGLMSDFCRTNCYEPLEACKDKC